jgi:hypothetical protein
MLISEGASQLPVPSIAVGEKLLAAFLRPINVGSLTEIKELTSFHEGKILLPSGIHGEGEILFFIASRTGMMVKRPAFGAEGFVLNHYDRSAVESYLKNVGDPLLQALQPHPPYAIFCDSLEVYQSDWTDDFLEEFQKRRGYDLKPLLPALALDSGSQTKAIRGDWGKTLTELFTERFMIPVHEWARKNKTLFRSQGYGIPPATIASNAHADLSEGEGPNLKAVSALRWASSANHLFGRNVTSSETWTWLHSPPFRATPLDMKAEANLHFLQGVNQLVGHGWPYSPENAEYPGWRFYAAGAFNEKNPWWIVMPDVALYLQRASYMLRQGKPVNDIAFYLPVSDAYASFTPGHANLFESLRDRIGADAISAILDAGYNFDFFDDDVLKQIGKVENGSLALGPNRYRAIILPNVERIPLETYRMLANFVRVGGVLIAYGCQPSLAPGFKASAQDNEEILKIGKAIFASPNTPSGYIVNNKSKCKTALREAIEPDVDFAEQTLPIGFVHRTAENSEIYFLANTSNSRQETRALMRAGGTGTSAEWWDPSSGKIVPAVIEAKEKNRSAVTIDLEPYGSRFLVLSHQAAQPPAKQNSKEIVLDISKGWKVTFGLRPSITMEQLSSWIDDESTRYFSGIATYEKNVEIGKNSIKTDSPIKIDFGQGRALAEPAVKSNGMQAWYEGPVREAAVVYINDKRAGSVWSPPYEVDITGLLQQGENTIRLLVANTAINHMAGRALPDYRLLNQLYGKRFDPQDIDKIQPIPSGILGPISITFIN